MKNSRLSRLVHTAKGFTLIELMIVVAVIGILGAVVYPSYLDSVRKSRRADAKSALLELAQYMERSYTIANCYDKPGGGCTGTAITSSTLPFNTSPRTGTTYYNLTITLAATPSQSFTLTATPTSNGGQNSDICGTLAVTNTGAKFQTDGTVAATSLCW